MDYPLSMTFKLLALAPQIYIRDANGQLKLYVKQQMFKLKEAVTVYEDDGQKNAMYTMKADRILDFGATYMLADTAGNSLGSVKRRGARSIWKATFDIYEGETHALTIEEENPWMRVLQAVLGQIPIVGMVANYLINPTYLVKRVNGTLLLKVKKLPAFFEGKFSISREAEFEANEEPRVVLSVLMMSLLEKSRG